MSIEALKEQARRHEQKEEWLKALDQYKKAIARLDEEEQPDIGLYNRVGDLFVRVGKLDDAVEHYDRAVDLYMEAELPNNAIAVCKKIIRNVPARHQAFLRMGQIRGSQGFLPDARTNFLTYAERMQQAGELDESYRALIEFCDLAPEEVELRVAVAEQMASADRKDEAVEQLALAYRAYMARGDGGAAAALESKIREIDPNAELGAAPAQAAFSADEPMVISGSSLADDGEIVASFGEIEIGGAAAEAVEEAHEEEAGLEIPSFDIAAEDESAAEPAQVDAAEDEESGGFELPLIDFGGNEESEDAVAEAEADDADDAGFELPMMDFSDDESTDSGEEDDEEAAVDLPLMDFGSDDEANSAASSDLDAAAFGEADHGSRETAEYVEDSSGMAEIDPGLPDLGAPSAEARESAMEDAAAAAPAPASTEDNSLDGVRARIDGSPDDVALRQRLVEVAYRSGDEGALVEAYVGLGQTLQRAGQGAKAKAAFQQALQFDPANEAARAGVGQAPAPAKPAKEVAAHEDYVDLGALILGDETEKSTRFVVAYEEPSGDEQADFAKMLSQFKEKVSANLDADDVRAHHDLGTAYKEMGLLDEAVSEFQQALRASADHLPTYEMLGQTFMEMGNADASIRSLERALEVEYEIEDELIGIYYYLARAYESVGNKEQAVEFYDRVFSLDINFADVTERLRALR